MTVDELIDLCDALLVDAGVTLEGLRKDSGELLSGLDDEQFLLAIRFVAGERPTASERRRTGAERYLDDRERRVTSPMLGEDEAAERLAKLEELEEETFGPVDIGDGVTLGLP